MSPWSRCTSLPPSDLRAAYLDALPHPQEYYLEQQVAQGDVWCCADEGYALVCDGAVVEFYMRRSEQLAHDLEQVMALSGARSVLCKSFDYPLLSAALARPASVSITGLLFRRVTDAGFNERAELTLRPGRSSDVTAVMAINDDFFDDESEVASYAERSGLFILERHGVLLGCGITTTVISERADVDVGMLVAKQHRGRGYGAYIISALKQHCLGRGERPICGCSADNVASARALQRAGFACEHQLLEFAY